MLDEDIGTLEIRNEIYFITQYVVMLNIVIIRIYCTSHILIPLYMQLSSICTFKCHAKLNKPLPIRAQYFNRSFINWQSSSQLPNAYCAQLSEEQEKSKLLFLTRVHNFPIQSSYKLQKFSHRITNYPGQNQSNRQRKRITKLFFV